ncbi:uncharacterized protein BDR25DRAFT_321733 [Lindgomyces ingoldianus]|uniref:Uncharacterized protein n=1 Tax=Lindgomyces ingoldianus TaxID=673940 RepID=A0ACB6RA72_9PLEO|nr:uncharacterized protein BDR25DRAFT_321733 [Lindgomyces ingoldianus]KAF2476173.1 hypothetical protein BDR25DRAFT_321733 [Lindgomyces ingoldianus]
MAELLFPAYESLSFSDAPFRYSSKLVFTGDICVEPHCPSYFWCSQRAEIRYYDRRSSNQEPWADLNSYRSDLIDTGFSISPTILAGSTYSSEIFHEHLRLLEVNETDIVEPMLLHPNCPVRNIFVSEDETTCITPPTFIFPNETPYMVTEPLSDLPLFYNDLGNPHGKIRLKTGNARRSSRYSKGVASPCQVLIELSQRWNELGLPGSSPHQSSPEEMTRHPKHWEDFNDAQLMRLFLA